MIRVLGIDPSLTGTGLVQLDEAGRVLSSVVRSRSTGIQRLIDIEQAVAEEAHGVDLVAIEGYAFAARASREALGELGGVLKRYLYEHNRFIVVPPTIVKKFATGRGNAKKDELRLAAYRKWGVDEKTLRTTDEVDAYVLARIALAVALRRAGRDVELAQYQAEALKTLEEAK